MHLLADGPSHRQVGWRRQDQPVYRLGHKERGHCPGHSQGQKGILLREQKAEHEEGVFRSLPTLQPSRDAAKDEALEGGQLPVTNWAGLKGTSRGRIH